MRGEDLRGSQRGERCDEAAGKSIKGFVNYLQELSGCFLQKDLKSCQSCTSTNKSK